MRNDRHSSFVICHLRWQQTGGTRELPKRQTAADGRESGFGGREPAQAEESTGRAGRPGNWQNPTALGTCLPPGRPETWNCRYYLTSSTAHHNLESSRRGRKGHRLVDNRTRKAHHVFGMSAYPGGEATHELTRRSGKRVH